MPIVSESIHVAVPPEEVWAFVNDMQRYPEWIYFVREVFDVTEGPIGKGTIYHERAKPGPFESVSEWQITEFDPPEQQTHVGWMPEMEAVLRVRLEPDGGGTRWRHEMDFRMLPKIRPLGWVLEWLVIKRKMRADFRRILETAKEILEREHGREDVPQA